MRVVLLGSGAREHALAWKISQSAKCEALYILPGNGGTSQHGENVGMAVDNFAAIGAFCRQKRVDCVVVGPEAPIVGGISDYFAAEDGLAAIQVIGPNRSAARLEGSKRYAKDFMQRHKIRTAAARSFKQQDLAAALSYVHKTPLPHVLKADGLAAGKGVIISHEIETSCAWLDKMLAQRHFGTASEHVLVEEYLHGMELSCFALCEGTSYLWFPPAKDYKKVGSGDRGPNTGGMGAISPVPVADQALQQRIIKDILLPTLSGLEQEGLYYRGFLFLGLMICEGVPYVLEYNVRLGDPEAQALLLRVGADLLSLFAAMQAGTLGEQSLQLSQQYAAVVNLAAMGYPGNYKKGVRLEALPAAQPEGGFVFHAGTEQRPDGHLYTAGGRVLSVSAMGDSVDAALQGAYAWLKEMSCPACFYREDIGHDLLGHQ